MNWLLNLGRKNDESGIALVSVIAIGAIMAILVTASVAFTVGGVQKSRSDEDQNSALAAAYAGIEEYQSLLANNASYVRFGNAASTYTTPPGRPDLRSSVTAPTIENPAFGIGATGTWANVARSAAGAQFRYEVNNSRFDRDGVVTLRSTGRVGDATRSLVADLKQDGFVAYVYFTDLETSDPYSDTSPCNKYAWAGRPSPTATPVACQEIAFSGGDIVDGDVHSNDRILICNATFKKKITTEYNPATGPAYKSGGSACNSVFEAGDPTYFKHIEMPPTNALLKKETRSDLTASDVPKPGCLYTGPTSIRFTSTGTMVVKSPWTKATQVAGDPATSGIAAPGCGSIAALTSASGAEITVPPNNVVYVQNVPASSSNPNYSAAVPGSVNCTEYQTGPSNNRVTVRRNNGLGYPITNEVADVGAYGCRNGDLFVEGQLKGKVTLAAENFVYITNNITYSNNDEDVLGLVGQNAVYVWNPVNNTSTSTYSGQCIFGAANRTIKAAILSVAHTFTVQNYNKCAYRGELRITGSIAQKFRGAVGTGSGTTTATGFKKKYLYDARFRYTAPPKFLAPLSTTYGVTTWVEIEEVFEGDGSYR